MSFVHISNSNDQPPAMQAVKDAVKSVKQGAQATHNKMT
jgi:hypothetical protein